jgi:uncharacterized membrane protein HdeD (DUF308 family)
MASTAGGDIDVLSYEVAARARRFWWIPLITGIAWIILSLIVFRFDATSVKAVGILTGVVFIVVGVEDLATMGLVEGGWKWLYGIFGVLLIIGGVIAISRPVNTFVALAALVGWILLIKGTFDVVLALTNRDIDLWWLRLVLGIIELVLAIAISGNGTAKAVFLVAFVGAAAMVKGIVDIVLAFQLRSLTRALTR